MQKVLERLVHKFDVRTMFAAAAAILGILFSQAVKAAEQAVLDELRTTHQGWTLDGHFLFPSSFVEKKGTRGGHHSTISGGEIVWGLRPQYSTFYSLPSFLFAFAGYLVAFLRVQPFTFVPSFFVYPATFIVIAGA